MYLFRTLSEVRVLTEDWRAEYNEERPHSSLGDMPPVAVVLKTGGTTKRALTQFAEGRKKSLNPKCEKPAISGLF
ncbi:integrase core domain-containing protein [Rouxiella aceris]|uniref:integrase core domain-containing protein n=1 Tax=Rouxiella aceris TaxID=2703884 RepID=UPI0038B4D1B0